MKLAWATDVHLDHCTQEKKEKFYNRVLESGADALLITGDISNGNRIQEDLFELAQGIHCLPIYYVLGNHDYWGSSITAVRTKLEREAMTNGFWATYLTTGEPVILTGEHTEAQTVLVGVDGWYDGRVGDPQNTPVILNDFMLMQDLNQYYNPALRDLLIEKCQRLALNEVDLLDQKLRSLDMAEVDQLYVATHVPPWRENSVYRGKPSDNDWAPWFVNHTMGVYLFNFAEKHSHTKITVLCGHSHGYARNDIRENLVCVTAPARYGNPKVYKTFDVNEDWMAKLV